MGAHSVSHPLETVARRRESREKHIHKIVLDLVLD